MVLSILQSTLKIGEMIATSRSFAGRRLRQQVLGCGTVRAVASRCIRQRDAVCLPNWPAGKMQRCISVSDKYRSLSVRRMSSYSRILDARSVTVRRVVPSVQSGNGAAGGEDGQRFSNLGLNENILSALDELGFTQPTEIQASVVPQLLYDRFSDFALASHTGSGKTLAYLLPIVHILKEAEVLDGVPMKPRRPRALILGPTRELVEQIYGVSKSLARIAKFRSVLLTGGGDMSSQKAALGRGLDILVGTPTRVSQHAAKGNLFYGDVDLVVLDEADTMMDRGFGPEVDQILTAVRNKANPARCILVSATMTKQVESLVQSKFPKLRRIQTSTLHKGVSGSKHSFLPAQAGADKLGILSQLVESDMARKDKTVVFCNTLNSCRAVEHYLREGDIDTVCYHGDIPVDERKIAISKFAGVHKDSNDISYVLVATDLAARGLDIPGKVDHVINFDFPLNSVDYLHRTGRTARAGAQGKITSLVVKADSVLARRIEEALSKGLPLDSLSANRAVIPPHMRPKPETLKLRALKRKAEKHGDKQTRKFSKSGNSNRGISFSTKKKGAGERSSNRRKK